MNKFIKIVLLGSFTATVLTANTDFNNSNNISNNKVVVQQTNSEDKVNKILKQYNIKLDEIDETIELKKGNYNKGFKVYQKYIKRKTNLKSTELIKILNVETTDELNDLFSHPRKLLLKIVENKDLSNKVKNKLVRNIITLYKKSGHKYYYNLFTFLKGIMAGQIPAGCS